MAGYHNGGAGQVFEDLEAFARVGENLLRVLEGNHRIESKLDQIMEAIMATQDDANQIAKSLEEHYEALSGEIDALKAAHPDIDLSGIQSVAAKFADLDAANKVQAVAAPAEPAADATAPAADASAPADAAPAEQAPAADAAPAVGDTESQPAETTPVDDSAPATDATTDASATN